MKDSQYLYGRKFDAKVLSKMPYRQALEYKVECAKTLVSALTEATTMTTDWTRISKIHKAIEFNQYLIKESKE